MRRLLAFSSALLFGCVTNPPPVKNIVETPKAVAPSSNAAPLSVEKAHAEILHVQRLAQVERLHGWKTWAADDAQPLLQAHALTQLVWLDAPERFPFAIKALGSKYPRVRVVAARALASGDSTPAIRSALLDALQTATDEEHTAILWTLVVHGEKSIAPRALEELRQGRLSKAIELDGRTAYHPRTSSRLFSDAELAALRNDPNADVRMVAAMGLIYSSPTSAVDGLVQLLKDSSDDVSAAAAAGLARHTDQRGRGALVDGLRNASRERRQKWLEQIRDIAGGPGLVLMLSTIADKPEETAWFQTSQIFDALEKSADPRMADPLLAWTSGPKRQAHWLGEAGMRLAEIGDIRTAKLLGARLRLEPSRLYSPERFWEAGAGGHLSRTDSPRVTAARLLADLAVIHQDKHAELLAAAERPTLEWLRSLFQPHANGLRFLAAAGSREALKEMREWAFPPDPLPRAGAMPPFPVAFETAQMGLRYIGLSKDEPSFPKLLEQLQRKKDKSLSITQEALIEGGISMMGMAYRAIGYGASNGLSHWRDLRAVAHLRTFIEDETWHEEARQAACEALAWCADDKSMVEITRKAQSLGSSKEQAKMFIGACYATSLSMRPIPSLVPQWTEALDSTLAPELRMAFARAIGISGFDATIEGKLFLKLENAELRQAAALALILGGTSDAAVRAVATVASFGTKELDALKDHYYRAFGYWNELDWERGNVYRWVRNAQAITHVEVAGVRQEWARLRLQAQFDNLRFDNGPHSETRVVLRSRLIKDAQSGTPERKNGAVMTLAFMREAGVLLALQDEPGEVGAWARKALHQVQNPVPVPTE